MLRCLQVQSYRLDLSCVTAERDDRFVYYSYRNNTELSGHSVVYNQQHCALEANAIYVGGRFDLEDLELPPDSGVPLGL